MDDTHRQNNAENIIAKEERLFLVRIMVEDMKFGDDEKISSKMEIKEIMCCPVIKF